jgi:small subunit ribosomal protein S21
LSAIRVAPGESIESALRRFKKSQEKENLKSHQLRHAYYTPPSLRRRQKSSAARKRLK